MTGLEGGGEHLVGVHAKPGEELGVAAGDPRRRQPEPVAIGVFADGDQDLPDRFLDPGQVDRVADRAPTEAAINQTGGQVVQATGLRRRAVELGGIAGQRVPSPIESPPDEPTPAA
jgi:hypothetical protein